MQQLIQRFLGIAIIPTASDEGSKEVQASDLCLWKTEAIHSQKEHERGRGTELIAREKLHSFPTFLVRGNLGFCTYNFNNVRIYL